MAIRGRVGNFSDWIAGVVIAACQLSSAASPKDVAFGDGEKRPLMSWSKNAQVTVVFFLLGIVAGP